MLWRLHSKFILIFLLILTWLLALVICWALNSLKTLIILIFQKVLRNFGADGIFRWELGLENMYIFRLAVIEKVWHVKFLICLSCGFVRDSGMEPAGTF